MTTAQIFTSTLENGGATVWTSRRFLRRAPRTGFVVGDGRVGEVVDVAEFLANPLTPIILVRNRARIGDFDGFGTWEDGGQVFIDPVTHHDTLEDALEVARSRGEKAIFDLGTGRCVPAAETVEVS